MRNTQKGVPLLAAALSLLAGAFLLLSGADPAADARIGLLRPLVPLPLLELSHLVGSVAGLALVILAGALYRRYDTARRVAILMLIAAAAAALIGREAISAALGLGAAAAALVVSRTAFYRHGALWRNAITRTSILAGLLVLGASVWSGFRAYANVAYSHDLWWQFAYDAGAPRFLRASLLLGLLSFGLLVARLLGPAREPRVRETPSLAVREAVAASGDSGSNLALLGDKRFLVSRSGKAFIMYQVKGRSWISMGDPVGPTEEWPELIWRLRNCADVAGGRAVFYETLGGSLDIYSEAGLVAHKTGEEARVDLHAFGLTGSSSKPFRAALRRGERDGLDFEIIKAGMVPWMMPDLQSISDEWIAAKRAPEKGFSLGTCDADYLAQFDCAIIRREGRVVAFANLWTGGGLNELSVDLMRHRSDAPRGTMMFLMLSLMLWGKEAGYQWFNLGMAPLAGLTTNRLAPRWHGAAHIIFTHGERLYGFNGLRNFKAQFGPVWRSRYVVCGPGNLPLLFSLADCARLISRAPPIKRRSRGARWRSLPSVPHCDTIMPIADPGPIPQARSLHEVEKLAMSL